jgi:hypothetical protein
MGYFGLGRLHKESYSFRIFFAIGIFVIIMSSIFTIYFMYHEAANNMSSLIKQGKTLSDLVAHGSRAGIFAENREGLRDLALGVVVQENVLGVEIYSANREVLVSEWKKPPDMTDRSRGIRAMMEDKRILIIRPGQSRAGTASRF